MYCSGLSVRWWRVESDVIPLGVLCVVSHSEPFLLAHSWLDFATPVLLVVWDPARGAVVTEYESQRGQPMRANEQRGTPDECEP